MIHCFCYEPYVVIFSNIEKGSVHCDLGWFTSFWVCRTEICGGKNLVITWQFEESICSIWITPLEFFISSLFSYQLLGNRRAMAYVICCNLVSSSSGERARLSFNESLVLWFNQSAGLLGLPETIHSSIWLPGNRVLHYQYRSSFQLFCSCCL